MTRTADPGAVADLTAALSAWLDETWDLQLTVREWWRRLADAGWAHPTWPTGFGGFGATASEGRAVTRLLARRGVVGPPVGHVASTLAGPTLLEHGTPAQIDEHVRAIAYGEAAWCQLFSEPGSGSDLASVSTRAERDGDEWVVTGQKVWSSGANLADRGMLLARTDPAAPKHDGLSYFAIDVHQPGVEVRPLRVMNGTTPFCEVFLTEARVADRDRIGPPGAGWRIAGATLRHERSSVAGGSGGLLPARSGRRGDLDLTLGEVVERHQRTSRPAGPIRSGAVPAAVMVDLARAAGRDRDPVVRQRLAAYVTRVRVNGWTMQRIATARGQLTGADGSMAKLMTARICQESREVSCLIEGAALMLAGAESPLGGDLQAVNLASPGTRIGGGTDEIQLNVLGERALGLPRERT